LKILLGNSVQNVKFVEKAVESSFLVKAVLKAIHAELVELNLTLRGNRPNPIQQSFLAE
jgi:hypothetical protein